MTSGVGLGRWWGGGGTSSGGGGEIENSVLDAVSIGCYIKQGVIYKSMEGSGLEIHIWESSAYR